MSFTQVFGGTTIYPSDVSYRALALTTDTTLTWPLETNSGSSVLASIIDITPTGAYSIFMPDATLTSVGQTVLFNNLGPSTVTIKDSAGATLLSLAAGEVWQIYLTDNTTTAGSWRSFKYGATTAQAQASLLAGYGLVAIGSTLAQSSSITTLAVNYTIGDADRAKTFVWTGGLGTLTLPVAATVGNNWFVNIRNGGTGDLVIDPSGAEIINGALTLNLSPGDSAVIVTDGTSWYTIGLGQQAVFAFDYTTISLTGLSGTYTLSGSELNRISYKFTGTLTGNILIIVPSTVQQYWIDNSTSGSAFTLNVSTLGGTPVSIAQNLRAIYYCNGSNVIKADTTSGVATPIAIIDGGTGATSAPAALINLGGTAVGTAVFTATSPVTGRLALLAAASGANSDITSLSGLTTPLSPAQGGTGITSLGTGVATALGINVGTAGSFTVNGGVGSFTSLAYTTTLTGGTGIVNLGSGQFYKDASGNVGIGSASPSTYGKLAVVGTGTVTANIVGDSTSETQLKFFTNTGARISNQASQPLMFDTGNVERMRLTAAGLLGVGTNVPATQLDVRNGDITLSRTAAATAGDAALNFGNGGTAYIFAGNTSNIMAFAVSSSERMRIDASGNVGIGTSSPSTYGKLAVIGNIGASNYYISDQSTTASGAFGFSNANGPAIEMYGSASGGAGGMLLKTANTERMRIDASGNVGIGASIPKSRLQSSAGTSLNAPVLGSATNAPFYLSNSDPAYGVLFGTNSADGHGWIQAQRTDGAATAYNLTLNEAGGSVGVGTTTPEYKLHVANGYTGIGGFNTVALAPSSAVGVAAFSWNRSSGNGETNIANTFNGATSSFEFLQKTGASTANVLYQMSSTSHLFYTANTEKMRIDNSGNVGIGLTAPAYNLHVRNASGNSYIASQYGTGTIGYMLSASNEVQFRAFNGTNDVMTFITGASERMRITSAGDVGIGTSTPNYKLQAVGLVSSFTYAQAGYHLYNNGSVSEWFMGQRSAANHSLSFSTLIASTYTDRMVIDTSGNVGIGTTGTYQLQVKGTGQETAALTDAGLKGGSLYLQGTAVGAGSGGAVLFGTTFANSTPFAAIKGFVEDGTTNTVGSLRFSTRNAIADTALTERAKLTIGGDFLLTSSGGLGYGTGSGGAVTQLTSRTTGVTLNKTNGAITMFSAAGNASPQTFVVTNSTVAISDVVVVSVRSSTNVYSVSCISTSAGAFAICFYSLSGTATDAPVINFAVIKASVS